MSQTIASEFRYSIQRVHAAVYLYTPWTVYTVLYTGAFYDVFAARLAMREHRETDTRGTFGTTPGGTG